MKKTYCLLIVILAIISLSVTSCKNEEDSIKDTIWTFNTNWQSNGTTSFTVKFKSDNTAYDQPSNMAIGTWSQDGESFNWSYTILTYVTTYSGTIDENIMSGTCTQSADTGTWTATRQ